MDSGRRGSRMVIDPKVRQVGFVTPGTEPPSKTQAADPAASGAADGGGGGGGAANSPSPVMIPPPRQAAAVPMPVPSPPPRRPAELTMPLGSPNPSDSLLATSPGMSPSSRNGTDRGYITVSSEDLSEEPEATLSPRSDAPRQGYDSNPNYGESVPKGYDLNPNYGGSVPKGYDLNPNYGGSVPPGVSAELAVMGVGAFTAAGSLPSIATVAPPGQASGKGAETDSKPKPLKERTSKAERRAIQDAQRAAKAAAKTTGGNKGGEGTAMKGGNGGAKKVGDGRAKKGGDGGSKQGGEGGAGAPSKETKGSKPPLQRKDSNADKRSVTISEKKLSERTSEKDKKKDIPALRMQFDDEQRVAKAKRRALVEQTETKNRVELFRHLPQFVHGLQLPALESKFFQEDLMHPHPAVYKVGLQYLTGDIVGGNARCVAMLSSFREAIKDYNTPPEKTLIRDLTAKINSYISFLITCRPLSISMGNAIKFLKAQIAKLPVNLSESEAKSELLKDINRFIYEKIVFADRVIVKHAVTKIRDGDVLLIYGSSCVVEMIVLHAHESGIKFRVVVVDSRPKLEGQAMLRRLLAAGLNCTYTHINAISYIMQEVTKVFLGAASVLSNGTVYSRVGTACVAMVAHASHVPVLICCEAYKFHERVQLDSICSNELGDPDVLAKVPGRTDVNQLEGWTNNEHLRLLNLTYDATPADYVSMIITDYGMVPPTSVPVIVREYRRDYLLI